MYAQILICASFVAASYQDIRERAVSDLIWVPALVGAAYAFLALYPNLEPLAIKVALLGAVALVCVFLGVIGEADGIAMAFIGADPYLFSTIPVFVAAVVILAVHIAYEYAAGNLAHRLTVPIEQFLREQRWIPKAVIKDGVRKELERDVNIARDLVSNDPTPGSMVEVQYGVPTVAYLGLGYLAYLVGLAMLYPAAFFALP